MTSGTDITTLNTTASTVVAESLSAVGYAMFTFLQNGPLENMITLTEFMDQVRQEQQMEPEPEPELPLAPEPVYIEPEPVPVPPVQPLQPKTPLTTLPEYNGRHTIDTLKEISFLDDE